jgi:hypothetical protein
MASARVAGVMKLPADRTGDGLCSGLADTAHGHAHVFAFNNDDGATRLKVADHRFDDLRGEALLHLRTSGVDVHEPGQLAQAGHLAFMRGM